MSKSQEIKLTNTQLKLLKIISCYMGISPSKTVYLNLKFICTSLDITDRQLRTVRKGISHLFDSKWRKATKIDGVIRKNVYVFKPIENNLSKTSELKGQKLPTSNKEDKNLNKNSVYELKKLCKYLKLNNYSKLDKSELLDLITQCIIFE